MLDSSTSVPALVLCRAVHVLALGLVLSPAALAVAGGCTSGCDADLQVEVAPAERELAVGERFTPRARLWGCGGTRRLRDAVTWRAADTAVVRVEGATGRVTALRPGATTVSAVGGTYGELGAVRVRVRARPAP